MLKISNLDMNLKITNVRYEWTHWDQVMHICISKLTSIGSDNGLSPGWCQAVIWTNGGILLIGLLATNFSEILIEIHTFSFKKMHLKISSAKWRPFCLGLIVFKSSHLAWCKPCRIGRISIDQLPLHLSYVYHKTSNIRRTKSQNLNDPHLVLQLSLPNPMKPGVKSRMKI